MARREPPLHAVHEERGAKFTEFGGWEMPVEFDAIRTEHEAVRERAGKFDVSHMGEIEVSGPDATELLQRLTTNDVAALDAGRGQYAAIVDEDGIMHDDTIVYRLPDDGGDDGDDDDSVAVHPSYLFVPNAGHDDWAHDRWVSHRDEWGLDCEVENTTEQWAMFAVQGPDSEDLVADAAVLASAAGESVREFSHSDLAHAEVAGADCLVSRTGYTGEDGFEVLCPAGDAEDVWAAFDCQPCGLGARDTLRTEKGFLLSGQDFHPTDEPRTPFEAGIGFVVELDAEPGFVGRDALYDATDPADRFVGLTLTERGVPRHGYDITDADGEVVGHVTSGTMSPTLGEPIGLGYVSREYADPGTEVRVVVRDRQKQARITETPFL